MTDPSAWDDAASDDRDDYGRSSEEQTGPGRGFFGAMIYFILNLWS